jgi:hypothetical protein
MASIKPFTAEDVEDAEERQNEEKESGIGDGSKFLALSAIIRS